MFKNLIEMYKNLIEPFFSRKNHKIEILVFKLKWRLFLLTIKILKKIVLNIF